MTINAGQLYKQIHGQTAAGTRGALPDNYTHVRYSAFMFS